jgi:lysophospholipase L1-like esterase
MKSNKIVKLGTLGILLALALGACTDPPLEAPTPSSGSADFSTYVALGDSYGAGFSDGAWYKEVQEASYPNLIAKSMMGAGLTEFKQPLIPEGNGFGGVSAQGVPEGKFVLIANDNPAVPFLPVRTEGDLGTLVPIGSQGPFQNLSVPGARATDLARVGYGSSQGNPLYTRFASSPTATQLGEAAAQAPTFFSSWIGGNDVLGYALAGGAGSYITPQGDFDNAIENMVSTLKQANPNVKGVMGNLPNILEAPYFTAVPWDNLVLDAGSAAALNAGLRATTEAGARPQVEAGAKVQVTDGIRESQVRPGVTAVIRATEVVPGVTAVIRATEVIPGVTAVIRATEVVPGVTAAVREEAKQQALNAGFSEAQAEAAADDYIASEDGLAAIDSVTDLQMQTPEVLAAIDSVTDLQMQTPEVLAAIDSVTDLQMQTPDVLAAIDSVTNLQMQTPDVLAAIDSVMQTPDVLALIEQTLEGIYATLPSISAGRNGFIYQGDATPQNLTGLMQATASTKILLPVLSKASDPAFLAFPVLSDGDVLDDTEIGELTAAMEGYNATLQRVASENDIAFANLIPFFDQVISANGYFYEGITYTNSFILGNTFSLDGFHLTDRGYALFANEYIKSINAKYGSTLSIVDVNQFKGFAFP